MQTVEQVIGDLRTLNGSTEHDFLAVGGKLMEFRSAIRRISSEMTALIELISGECGQDASHALDRMLNDSTQRNARIEASGQALASVRDLAGEILLAFSQLRYTVSTFRALCTLTRIETSRLGAAGSIFGNLADDVKPLSESIQASGEVILEASSRLDESIKFALDRCSGLQARQLSELPPLIAGVMNALEKLEERRKRARQTSVQQASQYREMGAAIEQLVTSLQIHDITRQQIEHVTHALEQLLPKSAGGLTPNAATVLALQSHQLSSANEVFASSIDSIEGDLGSIASRARETAAESRTLVEASGDERGSFFEQMESCFEAILNAVGAFDAERAEMESTSSGLGGTIERMRAAVFQIRGIEIQIQRIAINAAIGAIHIGSAGHALSLIAEIMKDMAHESNIKTESAAVALDAMRDALRRMSGGAEDASCSTGSEEANDAIHRMRTALSELHASSKSSDDRVNQIALAGSQLSDEISELRGGFTAGRMFATVVERVLEQVNGIREDAAPAAADHTEHLQSLAQRYTMQRERDVHDALLNGSAASACPAPEPISTVALEEDDLGSNVELF